MENVATTSGIPRSDAFLTPTREQKQRDDRCAHHERDPRGDLEERRHS